MSDIIDDRLKRITDLDERRLLRKILYDVYSGVAEYNMDMYERLERRLYDEIDDPLNRFYIYSCLEERQNIDPINPFLHPIIPDDVTDDIYDMDEINSKLHSGEEFVVASVFMKCDNTTLQEILNANRSYKGYIKTNNDIYEIRVKVRTCQKYIDEIEKLYKVFQKNGVVWSTVNCPYAYKFIDVVLNSALDFKENETVTEISVDLAEFDRYKQVNAIPLWNIERIEVVDKNFPMPARDRINYDHTISLEEPGVQNGYIVDLNNDEFLYCKRYEADLVIVAPTNNQQEWSLLKIESISNLRKNNFTYELTSNKRELGFAGRFASAKAMVVRTIGEIARLLQSYEVSGELHFQSAEILNDYSKKIETADFNSFIDDNIRVDADKKILLLKFKPDNREDYLVQDKMSFLVSEVQILFPEYYCIGELI